MHTTNFWKYSQGGEEERGRVKKGRSGRRGRCKVSKFMQSVIVFLACFIVCNLKVGGL